MDSLIRNRFQRIRQMIQRIEDQEARYEQRIIKHFQELDAAGIRKLIEEKQKNAYFKKALQQFLIDYEDREP